VVDLQESARKAKTKIWEHKNHPAVQKEKNRLLNTHVNRRHNDLQEKNR
jgi:deoxyribodipyrimidine photo-lyase